jgi:hypothetical protein
MIRLCSAILLAVVLASCGNFLGSVGEGAMEKKPEPKERKS